MPKHPETPADTAPVDAAVQPSDPSHLPDPKDSDSTGAEAFAPEDRPKEYGGRNGPDPVRYGDWEKNGRCIDF